MSTKSTNMIQLDLTYLETISGGDQAFIKEMLSMFLTNTFPEIVELRTLAANGDWDKMATTAHKMKAPLQMLGVPAVSDLVLELEIMGKTKQRTEQAVPKVETLAGYIQQLEKIGFSFDWSRE
ncbi:MAG: Hpt domain-containing protein, partial [Bacteroidota bacterium]